MLLSNEPSSSCDVTENYANAFTSASELATYIGTYHIRS